MRGEARRVSRVERVAMVEDRTTAKSAQSSGMLGELGPDQLINGRMPAAKNGAAAGDSVMPVRGAHLLHDRLL